MIHPTTTATTERASRDASRPGRHDVPGSPEGDTRLEDVPGSETSTPREAPPDGDPRAPEPGEADWGRELRAAGRDVRRLVELALADLRLRALDIGWSVLRRATLAVVLLSSLVAATWLALTGLAAAFNTWTDSSWAGDVIVGVGVVAVAFGALALGEPRTDRREAERLRRASLERDADARSGGADLDPVERGGPDR